MGHILCLRKQSEARVYGTHLGGRGRGSGPALVHSKFEFGLSYIKNLPGKIRNRKQAFRVRVGSVLVLDPKPLPAFVLIYPLLFFQK